ncbi:hypothetical protein NMG46_10045 [Mesorhizobium sp. LMG 17147]|uniref:hypothetical protein n=1 Tax=Mesorhizobium sp. LMG 17147 TaxID=2963091 RepID=UPI0020C9A660|nr:hypothetical protein [Mesorhizobium sp. LMG 17147]MCP9230585.1 hypothetical protein [Mesorhizobium sp. LMG 17147]
MRRRSTSFVLAVWAAATFCSPARAASDVCVQAGDQGYKQINDIYDPKIDMLMRIADGLKAKGFDPRNYPVVLSDGRVEPLDLIDAISKAAIGKAAAYKQVNDAVEQCNQGLKTPQKVTDAAVFFATGGLSAILPPRFTHVDVSEILAGKPFGGPNAFLPKARDDLLKGLGIGGDVACIIKDPKKIFGGC